MKSDSFASFGMIGLGSHLKEALYVNSKRKPLYAKLSNNRSLPLSRKLINYEKGIIWIAWIIDRVGAKYQKKGIPFMIHEFVTMLELEEFSNRYPKEVDYSTPINKYNSKELFSELKRANKSRDPEQIVEASNKLLEVLEEQPSYYNMLRHVVESIRRIAFLIPLHIKACAELNIKAPTNYSHLLIKSHQLILNTSKTFDEQAAPIQQDGIPFLWQDFPEVRIDDITYKS